jgi:eukaryotic-like serine/threonine-protein kinase
MSDPTPPPQPPLQITGDAEVVQQITGASGPIIGKQTNYYAPAAPLTPEQRSARQNREMLIKDTRLRVEETRASALRLIPLDLAARYGAVAPPGALRRPYDLSRRAQGRADEPLPSGARLVEIYDEQNGQLLILGAPGAGKSMLLHELALDLLERAEDDELLPVPVLFALASWQPGQTIAAWMAADLQRRYMVNKQLIERLVQQGSILPLLDGLDELATHERRVQCVAAINAYGASLETRTPLVVTCREREYQDLPQLRLNRAVAVKPLSAAQIAEYLDAPSYAALREALARDAELRDAASAPLLLGMMAQTYQKQGPQLPAGATSAEVRRVILEDYVALCSELSSDELKLPIARLLAFLGWLSRGMIGHGNQQEFYVEFLQPTWLRTPFQSWLWRTATGLGYGFILGVGLSVFGGLFGFLLGLGLGLSLGLFNKRLRKVFVKDKLIWSFKQWWLNWRKDIRSALKIALSGGIAGGLVVGLLAASAVGLFSGLIIGMMYGLIFGLGAALIIMPFVGLVRVLKPGTMQVRRVPNQGIYRSALNALRSCLKRMAVSGSD